MRLPNDVIQKIEKTGDHTKTKREPTIVSTAPRNNPLFLNPLHRSGTKLFVFKKISDW